MIRSPRLCAATAAWLGSAAIAFAQVPGPAPMVPSSSSSQGGGGGGSIVLPQTIGGVVNSGGIPFFSSATVMASTAVLVANGLMVGAGAGVAPHTVTTGAGILTALGIAPGNAGAPVLFNGVLGTPSSGVATNLTGLPLAGLLQTGAGAGDIIFNNGTTYTRLAGNVSGTQILQETASGVPSWASPSAAGVSSITTACPSSGPLTGAVPLLNALQYLTKTTSYTGLAADCGAVISFALTGAATYTPPAPAAVGAGYIISAVANAASSTANLTVTPASGTINGATSLILPPGSYVPIWVDNGPTNYVTGTGVGWDRLVFLSSGTWTPNPSLVHARIGCAGGGGGGGGGGAVVSGSTSLIYGGGGGGSGASKISEITAAEIKSILPTTVTITINSGGAGGAGTASGNGVSGSAGGTSVVGSGGNVLCQGLAGGGGGGGGPLGSAGGGGGGLGGNGTSATANSASAPAGGQGGGSAGTASTIAITANWCAGGGAPGGTTTTAAGRSAAPSGLCSAPAPSGGGVAAAGTVQPGVVGIPAYGFSSSNSIFSGGAVGGNGGSGQWSDGTFVMNGLGIIGGGSGGSGAACLGTGTGCTPGNGGNGGFLSGGGGGGAAEDTTTAVTGGTGGNGGPPVVEIDEFNSP